MFRIICAWCGKERVDGVWKDIPKQLTDLREISHSICNECYQLMLEQTEGYHPVK